MNQRSSHLLRRPRQRANGFAGVELLEQRHLLATLVGHWQADSLIGSFQAGETVTEWIDATRAAAAIAVGSPTLRLDSVNGHAAVEFGPQNRNEYLRVPASSNPLNGVRDFSIAAVFATSADSLRGDAGPWFFRSGLIDANGFGLDNDWGLAIGSDGRIAAGVGSPATTIRSSQAQLNDGLSHVVIMSQRDDVLQLVVDGTVVTQVGVPTGARASRDIKIGAGGQRYQGLIAEIQLYEGALGEAEVAQLTDSLTTTYFDAPPSVLDDSYVTQEDAALLIEQPTGVLANDQDPEGNALTAFLETPPSNGTLELAEDGSFRYTPNANFFGEDRFVYRASDGQHEALAEAIITVEPVADDPRPVPNAYWLQINQPLFIDPPESPLVNDDNPDGLRLEVVLNDDVANGTLDLNEDGRFRYQPNADFVGVDRFTYQIRSNDFLSDAVGVELHVLPSTLFITEVMPSNRETVLDEDEDSSDWIEIWNWGSKPVDLRGWFLTDDPVQAPTQWPFPEVTIEPGNTRLIFASGKDRKGDELHTNFRLAADGESVALIGPDGETVMSQLTYPKLNPDQSFGLPLPKTGRESFEHLSPWYLDQSTPAELNETADEESGLVVSDVRHTPQHPQVGDAVVFQASIASSNYRRKAVEVENVSLTYRLMYGTERAQPMRDDGLGADAIAGDGIYTAVVSGSELTALWTADEPSLDSLPGSMLRYSISVHDTENRSSRAPYVPSMDDPGPNPIYFGTTLTEDESPSTALPVFEWFVPDAAWHRLANGNNTRRWTEASVAFGDEFYDNIQVRVRGQTTLNWTKPKYKFEFNPGRRFSATADSLSVDEFNLQSHFREKGATSYMGENVAFEFLREIGVASPLTHHWHVRLNGEFHSLASYVEQIDETFLRRNGYEPTNALYKARSPSARSTLAPNPSRADYAKATREFEPFDDLREFTDALNNRGTDIDRSEYIFAAVNLPQVINNMAGNTILTNHDRLTKNYYVYHDLETERWHRFPWDMDQAFAKREDSNFSSVLYGDSEHPQATGQPIYQNHLLDAILDTPRTREMYLRRLRTLLDDYLAAGFFEQQVSTRTALIERDAIRDNARWNAGTFEAGRERLLHHIDFRRDQLLRDPLLPTTAVSFVPTELLGAAADVRVRIPRSGDDAIGWTSDIEFDDSTAAGWLFGESGVGYDRSQDYAAYLGNLYRDEARTQPVDLALEWDPNQDGFNETTTIYTRFHFNVDDPTVFDRFELGMRYDDAFVAYLNGTEIARANFIGEPTWESTSILGNHEAGEEFETYLLGLDGEVPVVQGKNVLSIIGINRQANSPDLLIQPTLVGLARGIHPVLQRLEFGEIVASHDDPLTESIEVRNPSDQAVDVSGWQLRGAIDFQFENGTVIPSRTSLFIVRDIVSGYAFLRARHPDGEAPFVAGAFEGVLPNEGGAIELQDREGNVIHATTFEGIATDLQESLRLTEVHYHPEGDQDTEFVELTNIGTTTLDLSGIEWQLGPREPLQIANGTLLSAGASLVIAKSPALLLENREVPSQSVVVGPFVGGLSNGGERLRIIDATGEILADFQYDDRAPWPTTADGGGPSLELISAARPLDQADNWRASDASGGTPGRWEPTRLDFNDDGILDVDDVDLLCGAIATAAEFDPLFDLTRDNRIDGSDLDTLLEEHFETSRGDGNLDGRFNSKDLVLVFFAGLFEQADASGSWQTGDWNCDGRVNTVDLLTAFQVNRYEA